MKMKPGTLVVEETTTDVDRGGALAHTLPEGLTVDVRLALSGHAPPRLLRRADRRASAAIGEPRVMPTTWF